jgi:holin-like protein
MNPSPTNAPAQSSVSALSIRVLAPGFALILAFFAAGLAVGRGLDLAVPAPLIGMALLALALRLRWVPFARIEPAANFLLGHMSLFFLPILFGAGAALALVEGARLPVLVAVVVGTVLTLLASYGVVRFWPEKKPRAP